MRQVRSRGGVGWWGRIEWMRRNIVACLTTGKHFLVKMDKTENSWLAIIRVRGRIV